MLGKIEGRRRRGHKRMRWLDDITDLMDLSLSEVRGDGQGGLACCGSWGCKELDTTESTAVPGLLEDSLSMKLFPC